MSESAAGRDGARPASSGSPGSRSSRAATAGGPMTATGTACGVGSWKAPTYENANASVSTSAGISTSATAFGVGAAFAIKVHYGRAFGRPSRPGSPWSVPGSASFTGVYAVASRDALQGKSPRVATGRRSRAGKGVLRGEARPIALTGESWGLVYELESGTRFSVFPTANLARGGHTQMGFTVAEHTRPSLS
jgi:hypothetical protein